MLVLVEVNQKLTFANFFHDPFYTGPPTIVVIGPPTMLLSVLVIKANQDSLFAFHKSS